MTLWTTAMSSMRKSIDIRAEVVYSSEGLAGLMCVGMLKRRLGRSDNDRHEFRESFNTGARHSSER